MFRALKKMFSKSSTQEKSKGNISPSSTSLKNKNKEHDLEYYLKKELLKSKYIRQESAPIILEHLLGKTNILKTANKLTKAEKKALGINARLSITKELISVLSDDGLSQDNPKLVIENMWHRGWSAKNKDDNLRKLKEIGVTEFWLRNAADGRCCEWCRKGEKKFNVEEDINSLVEANCEAPYCRCSIDGDLDELKRSLD